MMRTEPGDIRDPLSLGLRMIWDIDGVVDVVNKLGPTQPANPVTTT